MNIFLDTNKQSPGWLKMFFMADPAVSFLSSFMIQWFFTNLNEFVWVNLLNRIRAVRDIDVPSKGRRRQHEKKGGEIPKVF